MESFNCCMIVKAVIIFHEYAYWNDFKIVCVCLHVHMNVQFECMLRSTPACNCVCVFLSVKKNCMCILLCSPECTYLFECVCLCICVCVCASVCVYFIQVNVCNWITASMYVHGIVCVQVYMYAYVCVTIWKKKYLFWYLLALHKFENHKIPLIHFKILDTY